MAMTMLNMFTKSSKTPTPVLQSYPLKIILVGEAKVGKSNLLRRFADDEFVDEYVETIGIDFKPRGIELDGKKIKLQVWDLAGQERFRQIARSYYRGTGGYMVIYDVTSQESFNNVANTLEEVETYAGKEISTLLVGNKCDLKDRRCVDYNTARDFADQHGMQYIETSAKHGTNVEQAFISVAADFLYRFPNNFTL